VPSIFPSIPMPDDPFNACMFHFAGTIQLSWYDREEPYTHWIWRRSPLDRGGRFPLPFVPRASSLTLSSALSILLVNAVIPRSPVVRILAPIIIGFTLLRPCPIWPSPKTPRGRNGLVCIPIWARERHLASLSIGTKI
jgi:hypothetical protein